MKRFLIRQLSLVLALVMLLTLTGLAEDLSMDVLELQEVDLGELSLDDVAIDGDMELELSDIEAEAPMPEAVDESGEAPAEALEDEPIELGESGDEAAEAPTGEAAEEPTKEPAEEPTEEIVAEATEGTVEEPGLAIEEGPEENALVLVGEETEEAGGAGSGQVHSDIPGAQADNDALADAYLRAMLPGFDRGGRTLASPGAGRKMLAQQGLTATLALYDALKPMIEQVAAGKRTSTQFEFDAAAMGTTDHWWTPGELGASGFNDPNLGNCLLWKEGIDTGALMSALLEDCPYHLYWFDKTRGWDMGYGWDSDGSSVRLSGMTIMMTVSQGYAAGTYTVNALPAYVSKATSNINSIISKNASKGDLEKVTAYADVICNYVEYNHPAADNDNTPYGDPWQLVWIFDGNADTKVVCEGYAKGFKYLCDLSTFQGNVGCVLAQGTMSGGTGAGPHMWNSLRMPDDRVYLVDLTNCDAGDTCDYSLFLKGVTGEAGGPYVCKGLRYEFYDWIKDQFGENSPWLTYSNADYGKSGGGSSGDGKVNADWTALQAQINAAADNATVKLTKNITASDGNVGLEIPAGKRLTLDLAGHTLDRGLKAEKNDGYVLGVSGSLIVKDSVGGGKITGGWTSTYGGGIYVDYGASLTVAGGEISGNRAFDGGGIGAPNGTIVITGGVVSGNRAYYGGGVWLSGKLEMKGGKITKNDAYGPNEEIHTEGGGGICGYDADIAMSGGEISENRANLAGGNGTVYRHKGEIYATCGGGIYLHYGSFSMNGGTIRANTSTRAGGVMVEDASGIMTGGTISENTGFTGGGIEIHACTDGDNAVFTMKGGEISRNTAESNGGAANVFGTNGNADFIMEKGTIKGNKTMYGGGISGIYAVIHMVNGIIEDNTATQEGGGVYFENSEMIMEGGDISSNTAQINGGGIKNNRGTLTLTKGNISSNTAQRFGGGVYIFDGYGEAKAVFRMAGGKIDGNCAVDGKSDPWSGGGGVCLHGKKCLFEMAGGSVTGNTTNGSGGGVLADGSFELSGTPVIADNKYVSGKNKAINNCCLRFWQDEITLIKLSDALGKSAHIGIANDNSNDDSWVFTSGLGAEGNIGAFFSDDPNYVVTRSANGKEACLAKKATPTDPTQPTDPVIVPLSDCKITVKNQSYTGKTIKAKVTVQYGDVTLKKGTDYTVSYKNNKAIGVATVTVKGKGSYTGTKKVTFKILPRSTTVSKLTAGKKSLTVTWKKRSEATGYQVQYALKSSFSGAKTVKVKKAKTVKATIKSLKAGKKYYVRVRSYKTVGKKTYYSAWSKAKNVKVK